MDMQHFRVWGGMSVGGGEYICLLALEGPS